MDLIFLIGVVWTISKTIRGLVGGAPRGVAGARQGKPRQGSDPAQGKMVRDPVCGMFVSTEVSHRLVKGGEILHFCSQDCLESYQKQSGRG